ncbi:cytochrome c oxidase subunit 2A [Macrococcus armenti]|uniref:cytochrome c oxidase subunit 2A n=1 Tax=Macrococcus armenti TaxID=2875764 RepID=UPI001CCDB441|nr:cytochrome c oxidase subunit 2A [Macrococcus armenti]UBH12181.1 cytochrome c oxidase subunit 2A [Macrococcus armenti]UBH21333.1 cytochrome c oxidase subunit 2A [Macrococcus armenti]
MKDDKNLNQANDHSDHKDLDLRGTMASVLTLGAIFVITWFAIFILFIERI